MSNTDRDPFTPARLLDRRQFLGASAVAAAGLALPGYAAAAGRPRGLTQATVPKGLRGGSAVHPPYHLDVSSSLSQDHFLLKVAKIDRDKDTVVVYSRPDMHVEALWHQASTGIIWQIYRDPDKLGGWNLREIRSGARDLVAGVLYSTSFKESRLHVFYRSSDGLLNHLIEDAPKDGLSSATFAALPALPDWGTAKSLQITTNYEQELLVFGFTPSSGGTTGDAKLHFSYTPRGYPISPVQGGVVTGFPLAAAGGVEGTAILARAGFLYPTLLIYVPDTAGDTVGVFSYQLSSLDVNTNGVARAIQGRPLDGRRKVNAVAPPRLNTAAPVESVDYAYEPRLGELPVVVLRTSDGQLSTLSTNSDATKWGTTDLALPPPKSGKLPDVRWQPSIFAADVQATPTDQLASLFGVVDGTLHVLRQYDLGSNSNAEVPVFYPAVPLQDGVGQIRSQVRASSGDELIVVDDDGHLQLLVRAADAEWRTSEIHLPAEEPVQLSTYRVQLTLTDDWSALVADEPLRVTASGPVTAFVDGVGIVLNDAPIDFKTDRLGQLTIPVVADGLYAPMLTVTSDKLAAPVTVRPSEPVNSYMAGTAELAYMPKLDADGLGTATVDGGTVFPEAHASHDVAQQAASLLAGAAAAGADPDGTQSRDKVYELGTAPARLQEVHVQGLTLDIGKLAHDTAHAIKTGAATVVHVVVKWADDTKTWITTAVADFGAWAKQEVNTAIHGLADAAQVFHSVVNKLGGEVLKALKWLEVQVLGILSDTVDLAARYEGWIDSMLTTARDLLVKGGAGADAAIAEIKRLIHDALTKIRELVATKTIDEISHSSSFSTTRLLGVSENAPDVSHANSGWLTQKVSQDHPSAPHFSQLGADVRAALDNAKQHIKDEGADLEGALMAFIDTLGKLATNPKNFGKVLFNGLLDAFEKLVDAVLDFASLAIDAVMNLLVLSVDVLRAVLDARIDELPLVGQLLKAAGMQKPLTVGRLVSLLIAFPTVLAYKIAHLSLTKTPFAGAGKSGVLTANYSTKEDLDFCTGMAKLFEGLMSPVKAAALATGEEPPAFTEWLEIACPAVVAALSVPAHGDDLPFTSPIDLDDMGDQFKAAFWIAELMPGVLAAVAYYIGHSEGEEAGTQAAESTLYLTSLDGGLGLTFGIIAAVELFVATDPPLAAAEAAAATLDVTAPTLAWGLAHSMVSATDGVSAVLWGIIGSVCTVAAGTMSAAGVG